MKDEGHGWFPAPFILPGPSLPVSMPKEKIVPRRISLAEALEHLRPLGIGKSTFYGSSSHPGPRWTLVAELDIREGSAITLDRGKFFAWLRKLTGERARQSSERAFRLGGHLRTTPATENSFGELLSALCLALEAGQISDAEFQRAKQDLPR
jgi:hypothetical protein